MSNQIVVYEGQHLSVMCDVVSVPGKAPKLYEYLHPRNSVVAIVLQGYDVMLVKQYRVPACRPLFEFPAGKIDYGETPEEAIRRELREEIGLENPSLTYLGHAFVSPGNSDEVMHFFSATGKLGEPEEDMELMRIPYNSINKWISDGVIIDMKTIATVTKFQAKHKIP